MARAWSNGIGYKALGITVDGDSRNLYVHRLVLQTFKPHERYKEMEVNHIDGDKDNNTLENLEWVTSKENITHAWETGLIVPKLCSIEVIGNRECTECKKEYAVNYKEQQYCCQGCWHKARRKVKDRPTREDLYDLLKGNSFLEVGRLYGVSDNSIRKWCRLYGIPTVATYYKKYK